MAKQKTEESDGLDLDVLGGGSVSEFADSFSLDEPIEVKSIESIEDIFKLDKEDDEEEETPEEVAEPVEVEEEHKAPKVEAVEEETKNPYKVFAEILEEEGIVDLTDEFDGTGEGLVGLVESKIKKSVESYKESLHPKIKEIIESYEDGVPLGTYLELEANIEDYEAISEDDIKDNVSLQKDLVRESLSIKGYTKEQIDKRIARFIEGNVLDDEAIDAKGEILTHLTAEKEAKRKEEKQKQLDSIENHKKYISNLRETIEKTDEIIPGLKITKAQKEKLFDGITKLDRSNESELMKNIKSDPSFNLKVAYMALIAKWDMSGVEAKAGTKAAKKFRETMESDDPFKTGGSGRSASGEGKKVDFDVLKQVLKKH